MKPTLEELSAACRALRLIPSYPKEDHDLVLEQIAKFADRAEALGWLVDAAVTGMRKWSGVGELRGLWCTRFAPADGIEADCRLAGHTPADIESEKILARDQLAAAARKALPAPKASAGLTGLLSAARAKSLAPEKNYQPPDWLENL